MRAVVVILLAAALAGCGGTKASLDEAADATAAETSRFELDYHVTGGPPEVDFTMRASGGFDYPNERAAMTISGETPFFADDVSWKEFRLIGDTGYMRWVVKDKTYWVQSDESSYSHDPTELLIPLPGTPTKPTDVLTRVLLASEETEELGREEIRDAETTHYRARVDLRKLEKQLRNRKRDGDDAVDDVRIVPVELWIDDESRLRRITFVEKDDDATMKMTVELFDYGIEVDVEPPPADDVISEEEFDRLDVLDIEAETEVETGERGPVSPDKVCEAPREDRTKADRFCLEMKEKQ